MSLKRVLREPLLHFVVLGAVLFVAYRLVATPGRSDRREEITITQGQIDSLVSGFSKAWRRPPTPEELRGLVRDYVQEEVYCREAKALGLDQDDTIIRRRLRQKMEFISEDLAARGEPTEEDLAKFLQAHPNSFREDARFTFRQVFLDPEKHGADLSRDAAQILTQLNVKGAAADLSSVGDPFLLDQEFSATTSVDIAKQFGPRFLEKLQASEPGRWQGPIPSGFGMHLVLVTAWTDGRLPALAEVRDAVRREAQPLCALGAKTVRADCARAADESGSRWDPIRWCHLYGPRAGHYHTDRRSPCCPIHLPRCAVTPRDDASTPA